MAPATIKITLSASKFLKWFGLAFASWSSKKIFDATVSPFSQWFFDRWAAMMTRFANKLGIPPEPKLI